MRVITVARKPVQGTVATNALVYGTGGLDINSSRIEAEGRRLIVGDYKETASSTYVGRMRPGQGFDGGSKAAGTTDLGRWPANLILDGDPDVLKHFPESVSGSGGRNPTSNSKGFQTAKCGPAEIGSFTPHKDAGKGSSARFFYVLDFQGKVVKS